MVLLKRIGVLKSAYFMGLYGALIGFIAGLIIAILSVVLSSLFLAATSVNGIPVEGGSLVPDIFSLGWLSIILFPILYGIAGFVSGVILTPISNLIFKIIKGIDINLEEEEVKSNVSQYAPPQNNPQSVIPR